MLKFKQTGDFSKTSNFIKNAVNASRMRNLEKYAQQGVEALASATPVDTGLTASSWYYKIAEKKNRTTLYFCNSNIQNGVPIAIILQYGHATGNGGWVEGRDYINPAIQPFFDKLTQKAWEEVKRS